MGMYLTTICETYRVGNEAEAAHLIEECKKDPRYELKKYTSEKKFRKEKKEIVEEWIRVTLHKAFNDEKEPYSHVTVTYDVDNTNIYSMEGEDDDEISE